jgi:(2S)-methylsuccinyl-CoA dehydrogenase
MVSKDGKVNGALFDANQTAAHGYAWLATYVAALQQMLGWAKRLEAEGKLGELETLMLQAAFGEYTAQIYGGIPMSQGEMVRPGDLGLDSKAVHEFSNEAASVLRKSGCTAAVRTRIAELIRTATISANRAWKTRPGPHPRPVPASPRTRSSPTPMNGISRTS